MENNTVTNSNITYNEENINTESNTPPEILLENNEQIEQLKMMNELQNSKLL